MCDPSVVRISVWNHFPLYPPLERTCRSIQIWKSFVLNQDKRRTSRKLNSPEFSSTHENFDVWPGPSILLSFCFDWEDNYIKYSRQCFIYPNTSNFVKNTLCTSYFQLSSRCLDIPMKHCLALSLVFDIWYQYSQYNFIIRYNHNPIHELGCFELSASLDFTSPAPLKRLDQTYCNVCNGNGIYIAHFLYTISKCALQFNSGVRSDVSL